MENCDLLVVGLGPTGDVLAGLAAQFGLSVIAIERAPDIHPLPRAAVFDHEVMRVFQMLGIAERVESVCRAPDSYRFVTAKGELLLDFINAKISKSGWAETYALHQPAVERALRDRLDELDVDTRSSTALTAFAQDDAGVTAQVSGPGGAYAIRARYMVGCDGASSPVREALGVKLFDYGFDEPWLVLDTLVEDPGDLPIVCQQICDPRRPTTFMAMSGARFRWEFMLRPGETSEQMMRDETIAALLKDWNCLDRITIERKAVYRFHGLVAEHWRDRRVLLAGDAAHQMPPFAGQGMCAGVRDAANLAWKIAAVVGGANDALLDSYQQEREPHVRTIIETAIAMGKVVCILDEQAAAARDVAMVARKAAGEQDVSVAYPGLKSGCLFTSSMAGELFPQPLADGLRLDDRLGRDAILIGRDLPVAPGLPCLDLASGSLEPFAKDLDAWLAAAGGQAVIVRPDRYVFGVGEPATLARAWRERMRNLQPA